MKILNYTLILLFTFGLFSCGGGDDADKIAPTLSFTSPSTDAANPTTITSGQTINFVGTISDNKKLKSIRFTDLIIKAKSVDMFITDFNTKLDAVKPSSGVVLDKSKYDVNFSIETLASAPAQEYTLTCTVLDKSDNPETKTFYIKVE